MNYKRNGVVVKSFSEEEDAYIEELRTAGLTTPSIAAKVTERYGHPRSAHTINVRLVMLASGAEAA